MPEKYDIIVYGDSIMRGTVIDDSLNYSFIMDERLDAVGRELKIDILNRSQYGYTINKGQNLLNQDIENDIGCKYALIEYGGNDCNFKWDKIAVDPDAEHMPRTHIERFTEIYTSIIESLRARAITPIMMTLPPIDSEKYIGFIERRVGERANVLKWLGDTNMIYRFHELYSNTVLHIANQTKCMVLDVRSRFLDKHNFKQLIGLDGIHPAKEGYDIIVSALSELIGRLKEQKAPVMA